MSGLLEGSQTQLLLHPCPLYHRPLWSPANSAPQGQRKGPPALLPFCENSLVWDLQALGSACEDKKGPCLSLLRSLLGRCAGAVGAGDTRDVHAGLPEDGSRDCDGFFSRACSSQPVLAATFCTFLVLAITGHQTVASPGQREYGWGFFAVGRSTDPRLPCYPTFMPTQDWADLLTSLYRGFH